MAYMFPLPAAAAAAVLGLSYVGDLFSDRPRRADRQAGSPLQLPVFALFWPVTLSYNSAKKHNQDDPLDRMHACMSLLPPSINVPLPLPRRFLLLWI